MYMIQRNFKTDDRFERMIYARRSIFRDMIDKADDRGTEFHFDSMLRVDVVRSPREQKACYSRPARCPRE